MKILFNIFETRAWHTAHTKYRDNIVTQTISSCSDTVISGLDDQGNFLGPCRLEDVGDSGESVVELVLTHHVNLRDHNEEWNLKSNSYSKMLYNSKF